MLIANFRTVERIPVIVDTARNQHPAIGFSSLSPAQSKAAFPHPFVPGMMLRR